MLEGAGDPGAGDVELLVAGDRAARERDLAAVGAKRPREQIEHRGLAGAVRSDQSEDFAGPDLEADIVDGDETAKSPLRVAHLEKQRARWRLLVGRQCGVRRWRAGLLESGRKPARNGTMPCAGALQEQMNSAENATISSWPEAPFAISGRISPAPVLQKRDDGRTDHAAPMLPAPPTIAIIRYSIPMPASNGPGLTKRPKVQSHPDSAPRKRGYHERHQLDLERADPGLSTSVLPPRSARIARPIRESSRL